MSNSKEPNLPPKGQFLVYRAEDGRVKIDVRLENETVWLTQQQMAELFQTSKQNIGQHLKNIFEEGELAEDSVVKKFFTTAAAAQTEEGRHEMKRPGDFGCMTAPQKSKAPAIGRQPGARMDHRQLTRIPCRATSNKRSPATRWGFWRREDGC